MGVYSGPEIKEDGLVLYLDAGNSKGFDDDENLALNSEAINSWANNGNAISISANSQIAPDGTLTADVLSQTAVTGASRWVSSMTRTYTAGVTYTLSIWLKKISGTDAQPTINLWVNGGTTQSVGAITTEWVRYSKSFTPASTISSSTFTGLNIGWSDTGVANNFTFAAWGFQVETSSSASPYYATTGTAKIRGTTLIDMTGNGNTGTLTNGPTYSSANGGSLVFDGVNDYVSTGLVLPSPSTTATTFDLVFRYNSSNAYRGLIGASNYQASGFSIGFMGQSQMRNTYNASGLAFENIWNYNSSVISNGVFVFDGRNIYVYRNGSSVISYIASFDVVAAANGIQIGRNLQWGVSQVDVYSVKVYNRALSATEIQQNFNATRSRYGI